LLEVLPGALRCDGRRVPASEVHGFEERYDPWARSAFLRVRGPGHEEVIGPGYGQLRRQLRRAFPDRPFVASWDDGRFPSGWVARRGWLVRTVALVGAALGASLVLGAFGQASGVAVGCVVAWAIAVRLGVVRVRRRGIAVGPPWAPVRPWHAVEQVTFHIDGEVTEVEAHGAWGGSRATVPTVLLPALRGRVRRLGGLALVPHGDAADRAYRLLRPVTWGAAWGLLVGGLSTAVVQPSPWDALGAGALLAVVGGLAALAVEARAIGWAFGAILALTMLYGVVLSWLSWSL